VTHAGSAGQVHFFSDLISCTKLSIYSEVSFVANLGIRPLPLLIMLRSSSSGIPTAA
jgi:hypothetical protein